MNFTFFWDIKSYILAAIDQFLEETNFQQKKKKLNFSLSKFPPNYTKLHGTRQQSTSSFRLLHVQKYWMEFY